MSVQIGKDLKEVLNYARRVKNTRLVLFSRENPPEDLLKFLKNKHRYREIAVVEEGKYTGKCFRLYEPHLSLELPVSDPKLNKAITASILLLSPLLLLQREEELEEFSLWKRMGNWEDMGDLLRHIRIAEYAMIDAVEKEATEQNLKADGEKRFWRIRERGQTPAVDYVVLKGFLSAVLYYIT